MKLGQEHGYQVQISKAQNNVASHLYIGLAYILKAYLITLHLNNILFPWLLLTPVNKRRKK